MTLDEVPEILKTRTQAEAKRQLEQDIQKLLAKFGNETKLTITEIDVTVIQNSLYSIVRVKAELS